MDAPFDDERLQFFLRHRDDIKEWAAIEREVISATRALLAGTQVNLEERLLTIDTDVTVFRFDGLPYERIMAGRPGWPARLGLTLEWETGVDPFGSRLPKYGIFINPGAALELVYQRVLTLCRANAAFATGGFKVPEGRAWPIVKRVAKSKDWWRDPTAWAAGITDALVDLWPAIAPVIDRGVAEPL